MECGQFTVNIGFVFLTKTSTLRRACVETFLRFLVDSYDRLTKGYI